ncbi:MAG TPA: XrtA system polysaccharide deacetylase [Gemmatimonadales bacterium]|nr:XrtA system polysaccharide deacetylase [Gemmatimonadales bacterium]
MSVSASPPLAPAPVSAEPVHFFTVDVEEYFQVTAFEQIVARDEWTRLPSRVERSVDRLLDLLARHGAHGTFFTLGWVARSHPWVVRRIADAGHEIACHSYWHRRVWTLSPAEFRADVRDAKAALEDVTGRPVHGFRAPSFSIRPGVEWAFDVLLEEGYRYDSSLFPIRRPDYGYPGAPCEPHLIERRAGTLLELPLATMTLAGLRLPAAGGGYLRQLPFGVVRAAFRQAAARGVPAVFYIHPWEIDVEQPKLPTSWLTRRRHYGGLARTLPRLERLCGEFRFTAIAHHYDFGRTTPAPVDRAAGARPRPAAAPLSTSLPA